MEAGCLSRSVWRGRVPLVLFLGACLLASVAQARDLGARVEVGPDAAYVQSEGDDGAAVRIGAALNADVWGLGLFGIAGHFRYAVSIHDLALDSGGIVAGRTYITEFDLGPSIQKSLGPLRVRLSVGPWFAYSKLSETNIAELEEEASSVRWNQGSFLGGVAEGRVDVGLPVLSPYAFARVKGRNALGIRGGDENAEGAVDVLGGGGLRLNIIPFIKLGVSAYAGRGTSALDPTFGSAPAREYGADVLLTVLL